MRLPKFQVQACVSSKTRGKCVFGKFRGPKRHPPAASEIAESVHPQFCVFRQGQIFFPTDGTSWRLQPSVSWACGPGGRRGPWALRYFANASIFDCRCVKESTKSSVCSSFRNHRNLAEGITDPFFHRQKKVFSRKNLGRHQLGVVAVDLRGWPSLGSESSLSVSGNNQGPYWHYYASDPYRATLGITSEEETEGEYKIVQQSMFGVFPNYCNRA